MIEYWKQELDRYSLSNKNFNFTFQITALLEEPDCHLEHPCDLDLLIDARSDGIHPSHADVYTTELIPEYDTTSSRETQSWIRQWLEHNGQTVLILLDPTIGHGLWPNMKHTRTLQRVADWYQIPFLSLAPIHSISNQETHSWKLALELVLFAVLDFTILFCHGTTTTSTGALSTHSSPILKAEAQYRAEYVLPPPLDTSLSWQDVTRQWESAQYEKEERRTTDS
jgi:hypothetical protein